MQTRFPNEISGYVSSYQVTFLMHRIRNVSTQWAFVKRLSDKRTSLPISPAVTYLYTLL